MDGEVLERMRCRVLRKPFDTPELLSTIAATLGPVPAIRARGTPQPVAVSRVASPDGSLLATGGGAA